MAGTLRKVRFKLAWQTYRIGDEIMPNGTLRDFLVGNGFADIIEGGKSPVDRQQKVTNKRQQRSGLSETPECSPKI